MPTRAADQEPIAKQLRLILTGEEWHSLRVMAAEQDTSMQALVAATVQREIVNHLRAKASEKALRPRGRA
jgi:hypothetical protein